MDIDEQWNEDDQMMWADTAVVYKTTKTKAQVQASLEEWWEFQDDNEEELFKCNHGGNEIQYSNVSVTQSKSRLLEEKLAIFTADEHQ